MIRKYFQNTGWREDKCRYIVLVALALVYAAMLSFGGQMIHDDKIAYTDFSTYLQITGYFVVGLILLQILYRLLPACLQWTERKLLKLTLPFRSIRLFLVIWLFVMLTWLPILLACWPGVPTYDIRAQMDQIESGVYSSHHPLIHTLFIEVCLKLAEHFWGGGLNSGFAVYSVIQCFAMSGMFAGTIVFMVTQKYAKLLSALAFFWYALFPLNALFGITTTKDSIFSCLFLMTVLCMIKMQQEDFWRSKGWLLLSLVSFTGMSIFRNNGAYVFYLLVPVICIMNKKNIKKAILLCGAVVILVQIYLGPFSSILQTEKGDSREMFSVPMQQFARVYRNHELELEEAEKQMICQLIDEEYLNHYDSHKSDSVKYGFQTDVYQQQPFEYVRLWLQLAGRYPQDFADAFFALTYGNFYPKDNLPDTQVYRVYFELNSRLDEVPLNSKLPRLFAGLQDLCLNSSYYRIPGGYLFFSYGFAFWIILFLLGKNIMDKAYGKIPPFLATLFLYATILAGPVALLRYMYPIMVCIPLLFGYSFQTEKAG